MLLLAPLFIFIREDFGVSYTELGLALTAFNVVSTVLQTPVGFLVDRGTRATMLIAGLLLGAAAFAVAGLVQFVLGVCRDVRGAGPRQHRLSPGRLRAARARTFRSSAPDACSRTTPSPACSATQPRRRRWSICIRVDRLARRLPVRRGARRGGRDRRAPDARAAGGGEAAAKKQAKSRPTTPRSTAGSSCCRRRSCSTSCSSSCSRCRAAGSTTISWRRSARCTARRRRSPTPR